MLRVHTYSQYMYRGKESSPAYAAIVNMLRLGGMLVAILLTMGRQVSYAQTASGLSLDPAKSITQYHHKTWGIADGLPQSYANDIEQTPDGYLWITTQEGLARFDGIRFTVFDNTNEEAFLVNSLHKLHVDRNGTLWITSSGGGLIAYTDGRFESYTQEDGLGGNAITSLYEDSQGSLWIGSIPGGLNRLKAGKNTTYGNEENFPCQYVLAIGEDAQQNLWIGTDTGLYRFEDGRFIPSPFDVLNQGYISLIFTDRDSAMWVATRDGGLYQVIEDHIVDYSTALPELEGYITTAIQDSEGSLWFGGAGGLFRSRGGSFETYTEEKGLVNKSVISLFEDREGNLWVGTKDGLVRITDGNFTPYTSLEGLIHDDVKSVYEDVDGAIWVGTYGGVSRLKDGRVTTITAAEGLSSDMVLSVNGDASGAIWIGTMGAGLNRLKDGEITHFTTADGLGGNTIYALYSDSRGNMWIATDAGVNQYDGRTFELLRTEDGLNSDFPTAFHESIDGSMWIGMYDAGINRIKNGEITTYTSKDGLANDGILSLYEDEDGVLWIGHNEGGLSRWENGTFSTYSVRDGLFSNTVMTILEAEGDLWMSCNKGVFRVTKAELNAYTRGELGHISSFVYGVGDGLKSVEGNGGQQPVGWKTRDGSLWFTTTRGVVSINPASIKQNSLPPTVVIERLTVDNKSIPLTGSILLPPGSDKLEFQYTGLSLVSSENVRFMYMLEGQDDTWFDAGNKREAHYTNLSPGSYTLHVIAANSDGICDETGASLSFELAPFFFQTRWFFLFCIVVLCLLLLGIHRLRVSQLKARERQLERTVDERTSSLRLSQKALKEHSEALRLTNQKLTQNQAQLVHSEKMASLGQVAAGVAHEINNPLSFLQSNLATMGEYFDIFEQLFGHYDRLTEALEEKDEERKGEVLTSIQNLSDEEDLEYVLGDVELLIAESLAGADRVKEIVKSLKSFARIDEADVKKADINEGLEATLRIVWNELKNKCTVEKDLQPLPLIRCFPGQLNQVFMNLLVNAMQSIPEKGTVTIETEATDSEVLVQISDTGTGITAENIPKLFIPFYTTKPVGAGTGLGLSISYGIIKKHNGRIEVESELGKGTTFTVHLPIISECHDRTDTHMLG